MEINKSIAQGFGKGELYDTLIGMQNEAGAHPITGQTLFVNANGNNTTGLSWDNAYKTLTAAITANNTYATLYPYNFNRIYLNGGNWDETLVVFPIRCQVIGVGPVTRIIGTSVLTTAATATKFYNIIFRLSSGSTTNVNLLAGSGGVEFHGCQFTHSGSITPTSNITVGNQNNALRIISCSFIGTSNLSASTAILFEASNVSDFQIKDCLISAIAAGISFASGMTNIAGGLIERCKIGRFDGNVTQPTVGINFLNTTGTNKGVMIVDNFIDAATPLLRHDQNLCMGNRSTISGDAYIDGHVQT